MKQIKRYLSIFLIFVVILFGVACKDNNENKIHYEYESSMPESFDGILKEKKLYITSIGQSMDMENFLVYLEYLKDEYNFEYVEEAYLNAKDVEDDAIVFVFVGCSIKAMQESGTSVESEKARAKGLIELRNSGKIKIVSWHTGGNSRRGATSDDLIEFMLKGSDLLIFAKSGNEDLFLSDIAVSNNVPLFEIETASQVRIPLITMLGSR